MIPTVIPFYKNRAQLDRCLKHLFAQTLPVRVFVRDNTHDNIYFTRAVNQGIRHFFSDTWDYILILNQDMYLMPDAVAAMVRLMTDHPDCGIVAPLQLHPQQRDTVIWGGSFEAFPVGRHDHGPLARFSRDRPVPWANGACMLLRRTMIESIGLLDENLVFIGSDSDYSFTARSRGWTVWCAVEARGIHEHGASGVSGSPEVERRKLADMRYFGDKWLTGGLYRRMAHEGDALDPDTVSALMTRMAGYASDESSCNSIATGEGAS